MSKKFSDFAQDTGVLEGSKIKIDDLLNKEIEVIAYSVSDSKYKQNEKCLKIQFKLQGEKRVVFTGSSVLARQCDLYKNEMPFIATIKKVDKCYTFS